MNRAKIICTLGPSSRKAAVLKKLILAGMNVARLNFSHGTYKTHKQSIDIIARLNRTHRSKIKILQDLEGYRIRVGLFKGPRKTIELVKGSIVTLINKLETDKKDVIPFDYEGSLYDIKTGCHIFIDDGNIALCERVEDLIQLGDLAMLKIRSDRFGDAKMGKQMMRRARVFGGDERNLFQDSQRAQGNIFEIANGCSDEVKYSHIPPDFRGLA